MILVHKPQSHFPTLPAYTHRRHPSAPLPALVAGAVQPTRTPGLLSLSKPQQQAQRTRASPKLKHKSPQPGHAVAALQPAAEIVEKQSVKASQSPEKRGRQAAAGPKAKAIPRSVSNRRHGPRQPSPPISSTQAEVPATPTNKPSKPFFDSFLVDAPLPAARLPTRSPPKLAPKPSGKLASRRRQGQIPLEATPPKAIPVPTRNRMPLYKRASAPPDFAFPICDDISEAGDAATDVETEDVSPPKTPTQPRRSSARAVYFDNGPKTAPLTSSASMPNFPFSSASPASSMRGSSPKKAGRSRYHVRSPSEGVFQMSDEEASGSSSGTSSSEELKALFGGLLGQKRAMYASSTFLNSPDPEELPPPSF